MVRVKIMHCEESTHTIPAPLSNQLPERKADDSVLGLRPCLEKGVRTFSGQSQEESPNKEDGGFAESPDHGEVLPHE